MNIGTIIKETRIRRGISQRELARQAVVDYAAMCRYESGQVTPSLEILAKLAAALGTETATLVGQAEGRTAA